MYRSLALSLGAMLGTCCRTQCLPSDHSHKTTLSLTHRRPFSFSLSVFSRDTDFIWTGCLLCWGFQFAAPEFLEATRFLLGWSLKSNLSGLVKSWLAFVCQVLEMGARKTGQVGLGASPALGYRQSPSPLTTRFFPLHISSNSLARVNSPQSHGFQALTWNIPWYPNILWFNGSPHCFII